MHSLLRPGPLWKCAGSGAEAGVKGDQAVVVLRQTGGGGDVGGGLVGRTEGGVGGYRLDGGIDGLNLWEDTVSYIILGMDHNAPLEYALVLELRQPIISTLGEPRV